MAPRRICIVGGGTAGWLAALMLGDAARRAGRPADVTVIESSKFGTIGVGEGTTAVFRQMLRHLDLDEEAFLAATGATIKFGIRHRDWRRKGHSYDGPIDDPHRVTPFTENLIDVHQVANGRSVAETHLFGHLMRENRSPYADVEGRRVAVGPFHHAFHFDQALAGRWLRSKAGRVAVIDDQVLGLERDPQSGDILALRLEGGDRVEADLFVDCTGFRRALIGPMGAAWVGYRDMLPVNRAIPFWLDIGPDEEIEPVTLAWAQGAGWMWKIPTATRYGCGYVFSDAHISADEAKAEIEAVLGHRIEVRNDIRIDAGRLDRSWIGNCVALGLSSSFLEPLEATSIHGTVVQLMLLCSVLAEPGERARAAFNAAAARQVDDFRDFIRLHYVSERRDTPFWRDLAGSLPDHLADRLALWRTKVPGREDFAPFPMNLPHTDHHLHVPVLDGLGLLDPASARDFLARRAGLQAAVRRTATSLTDEYRAAARRALGHRAFLRSLHAET